MAILQISFCTVWGAVIGEWGGDPTPPTTAIYLVDHQPDHSNSINGVSGQVLNLRLGLFKASGFERSTIVVGFECRQDFLCNKDSRCGPIAQ
jgi:hypothetical protein